MHYLFFCGIDRLYCSPPICNAVYPKCIPVSIPVLHSFLGDGHILARDQDQGHIPEEADLGHQSILQEDDHHHQRDRPTLVSRGQEANLQTAGAEAAKFDLLM